MGGSFLLAEQFWHKIFEVPQTLFAIGCIIALTGSIGSFWCRAQNLQSENALKRTLAERGMSADEIERIIAARTREPSDSDA